MKRRQLCGAIAGLALGFAVSGTASATTFQSLLSFTSTQEQPLVSFRQGNTLYGDTMGAGPYSFVLGGSSVTQLASIPGAYDLVTDPSTGIMYDATQTTLYKIPGGGQSPVVLATMAAGISSIQALNGTIYGSNWAGQGTVFTVNATTKAVTSIAAPGLDPIVSYVDGAGNVYGTTVNGGTSSAGTIFKWNITGGTIAPAASFNGSTNGISPLGFAGDGKGNFYGYEGNIGTGIFKFVLATNTVSLPIANIGSDGINLIVDANGDYFGTTIDGGSAGDGTVFEIPAGTTTVNTLVTFTGTNGIDPQSLYADSSGNLFGSTFGGGSHNFGTLFEITGAGFVVAPEPASVALLGLGFLALVRRRTQ